MRCSESCRNFSCPPPCVPDYVHGCFCIEGYLRDEARHSSLADWLNAISLIFTRGKRKETNASSWRTVLPTLVGAIARTKLSRMPPRVLGATRRVEKKVLAALVLSEPSRLKLDLRIYYRYRNKYPDDQQVPLPKGEADGGLSPRLLRTAKNGTSAHRIQ